MRIYVIEFQKRGLPHAHIVIFFAKDYKPHMVKDVDRMISVELSNLEVGPRDDCQMHDAWSMWSCVSKCPMHGRWQMQKKYPCKFQFETVTDVNEYFIYRCRDMGCTFLVHGVELDNRWVVPHNVYLSTKYDAHINVEVCNNISIVKYLFKYVYKGHDHATF
jgi:hypothetical protein